MTRLGGWKWACTLVLFCTATRGASLGQIFTTLQHFDWNSGGNPRMSFVQGTDGNLYGTTSFLGPTGYGTVFGMTPDGRMATLYSFCAVQPPCTDGAYPTSGLVLATDGDYYGTTGSSGVNGGGTVFKINPRRALNTLASFSNLTYSYPLGVIQATDGNFYGTTGGDLSGDGTVFQMTPWGILTTLYVFCSKPYCPDGSHPYAGLIEGIDGDLYGTTYRGGEEGSYGTIFKISGGGQLTTLHTFNGYDGGNPAAGLIRASDGSFYGTSYGGGTNGAGTVFRMTASGKFTTLYAFCSQANCSDGENPVSGLFEGTDGNLYGTTIYGGSLACNSGCGTIFKITKRGELTTLHRFDFEDGLWPKGGLFQATNGILYGTSGEGMGTWGTIFSLDMGLGPFVAFVRDSGRVGGTGGILGQGFTGTTDVSVNGTPAKFKVVSDTFLKATVPDGATTGFVTVTTLNGTLTSNKPFRVTPQLVTFDPPSGPVGTQVTITGVSLTQTLGVGFGDHVPAQFTVDSDTQVTATVPAGAKTGKVGIETKGGIAISSGTFTVTP
ncbi:MAG: hypothetical protein LAO09_12930 [Acidobacteriia bacterium]|nr:hypothetical protein [Terriglobia bacterium]